MPRSKNRQCQLCAAQSIDFAQTQPCWVSKTCRAKRSYYKHRPTNLAKKRSKHRSNRVEQLKTLDIPLFAHQPAPEVLMTFYRDRADGPIHALEFAVIDNGVAVAEVKAIHLKGVPQSKLRSHIKNVLGILNAQFQQEMSVSQGRQPAKLCPLCLQEGETHD
ncbi:MAG: hypothetical protein DCF15_13960 [Phormidesmis priestleyi]|uniref:Uncharacterized protein n=1 Tax=Phormidesmis priestleyi TaxID=268141 RepID=A0A2W4ZBI1_9CYAN|nr:MAG: hypothetical protein DCF15_13960 [Phormidesmis priestleyi]